MYASTVAFVPNGALLLPGICKNIFIVQPKPDVSRCAYLIYVFCSIYNKNNLRNKMTTAFAKATLYNLWVSLGFVWIV
jgi:hypothetical protein